MSAAVTPMPGSGYVPGLSHRRATLRKHRQREILLAIIEEHQKWIEKHQAAIASHNQRIGELLADLRALDGYRTHEWEVNWPWAVG